MDIKAQVRNWVEQQIGSIVEEDLKFKTGQEYSQFNIQTYVNNLENKYFTKVELEKLTNFINGGFQLTVNDFNSFDSDEESDSKDFLELTNHEFQTFSIDETVKYLESNSEDISVQSLEALEAYAEEIINHTSWIAVEKTLLKILKGRGDKKIYNLVLKVTKTILQVSAMQRIKISKIVAKGFTSVSKVLASLLKDDNVAFEKVYDVREDGWLHEKKSFLTNYVDDHFQKSQTPANLEVIIKLMWLLIYCQQQMPEKWVRFNEKRLREIIFPFIHLLSSSNVGESKNLTALELLSILNPTASWCHCWCHTAVGRNVLCSALRKHKKFFVHLVEIILNKIKTKKIGQLVSVRSNEVTTKTCSKNENECSSCFLEKKVTGNKSYVKERTKHIRSAPVESAESDRYLIFSKVKKNLKLLNESIPQAVAIEAVFWHSVSVVVCLIQFRCGQALFPIQIGTRKRSLSAQDLSLSLIEYLENLEYNKNCIEEFGFSSAYQAEVLKKIEVLRNVRNNLLLSRMKLEESPILHR